VEDYDLVGAEYAELNHADFGDLRWRVRESNIHGDRSTQNPQVSARESSKSSKSFSFRKFLIVSVSLFFGFFEMFRLVFLLREKVRDRLRHA